MCIRDRTVPLLVDATGKNDFFPTLYTLNLYPKFAPVLILNPGVESYIFNGANLMWPGVSNKDDLGTFAADDVRCVQTADGKIIAVGAMACSSDQLKKSGPQGQALFVLHLIDDQLWELGDKKVPTPVALDAPAPAAKPEEAKKEDKPKEAEISAKKEESEESEEEEEDDEDENADLEFMASMVAKSKAAAGGGGGPVKAPAAAGKKAAPVATKKETKGGFSDDEDDNKKGKGKKKGGKGAAKGKGKGDDDEDDKKGAKGKKGGKGDKAGPKKKKGGDSEEEGDEEGEGEIPASKDKGGDDEDEDKSDEEEQKTNVIPTKIMDEYLMEAFFTALKISVKDKDLPMDASVFQNDHLLLCKPENVILDMKNSSYKKLGKFLQVMDKQGYIDYKEAKKGQGPMITKIHREKEDFFQFMPKIKKAEKKEKDANEEKKVDENVIPKVELAEVYKPRSNLKPIFATADGTVPDKYYTEQEAHDAFQKFLTATKKLEKKNVFVDVELLSIFPEAQNLKKTEEEEEGTKGEGEGAAAAGAGEGEVTSKKKGERKSDKLYITKDQAFKMFGNHLDTFHRIRYLDTGKEEIKKGEIKPIHLIAEKAHNKNITRIAGLETFAFNINAMVTYFQVRFACSVSTHDLPGKNAGREVVVHGNFLNELIDFFTGECKIDSKHITSVNKLDKKKKGGYQIQCIQSIHVHHPFFYV
eukprot:TRINITY_DN1001_c0_g1_i1.p1 TRINITY_DN1001_c0_g1~~TRINITY_DN1001_c0_g1_i1.p1  ORF type:complete len:729 (-),score=327.94 TRINITY_DN1001_c0_g1_i1:179-2275(-)